MHKTPAIALFPALIACVIVALVAAIVSGSAELSFSDSLSAALGRGTDQAVAVVLELRLPRALTA